MTCKYNEVVEVIGEDITDHASATELIEVLRVLPEHRLVVENRNDSITFLTDGESLVVGIYKGGEYKLLKFKKGDLVTVTL